MPGKYPTTQALARALDDRLRQQSISESIDLLRLRRRAAFERLLARLFYTENQPWILKGGYSLELRLPKIARATIDLDLSVPMPNRALPNTGDQFDVIRDRIQIALEQDLEDTFTFRLRRAEKALEGPRYGGLRFYVDALQNNKLYIQFQLDVGLGDVLLGEPDWVTGYEVLSFADIEPARIALLPIQQHFAEKIHAYTLPRDGEVNSRIKDLVDLVLLIDMPLPDSALVTEATRATFSRRDTHKIPTSLPDPPDEWETRYPVLASACGASKLVLGEAIEYVSSYWKDLNIAAE